MPKRNLAGIPRPRRLQNDKQKAARIPVGRPAPARADAAAEVAAAIAHQLNGPLTAAMLYVGDLKQNSDRFPAVEGKGESLKQIADNAFREIKRACLLLQQISDAFEAPLQQETAVAHGREVIHWWSRTANMNDGGRANAGNPPPSNSSRSGHGLLTMPEREVLRHISEGCSNREGAARMKVSVRTFQSHRAKVMKKFGAKNSADLVRMTFAEIR